MILLFICMSVANVLPISVVFTVNSGISVVLVDVINDMESIVVDVKCNAAANVASEKERETEKKEKKSMLIKSKIKQLVSLAI